MKPSSFPFAAAVAFLLVVKSLVNPDQAAAQRPLGIDVSSYQGSAQSPATNIVWSKVKSAGISFAWAKAAEGTYYVDADYVYNTTSAKNAGVYIGAYYFARPDDDLGIAGADTEAAYFWNVIQPYVTNGYLMPMLDYETSPGSSYTIASSSAWVNEWCNQMVNYGKSNGVTVRPVIYTFTSFAATWLNSSVTNWPLWMASYPANPSPQTGRPSPTTPWGTNAWTFWQYSSTNKVSGVTGNVDVDTFRGDSNTLVSFVIAAPVITNQPLSVSAPVGTDVNFSVIAGGGTLHYQWRLNGINIASATNAQLSITNVQLTNAGGYTVFITNSTAKLSSSTAELAVIAPLTNLPGSVVAPPNLVDWWTADGNTVDIAGTINSTVWGGLAYSNGENGLAFRFDGNTTMISNNTASLAVPWTVTLWVNRQNTPQTSAGLFEDGTNSLKLEQYPTTHEVGLSILSVGDYVFSPAYTVPVNTWTHLAFVGTSSGTSLYVNGNLNSSLANSIPLPRKNIGAGYISSSYVNVDFLLGSLDEIMVFNRALTGAEIGQIYSAGAAGLVRAPQFTGFNLTNGDFLMNLEGLTGKNFTIQSTPDFTNWTTLTTLSGSTGTNQYTDATATNAQTFYRAYQP